jgi:spore coat protein U-like protein
MNRSRIAAAILASTALVVASPAFAVDTGNDEGTIAVSLTVYEECTLETEALAFPTTGIVDENVETSATLTIECTRHSPYEIGLSAGLNAGGTDIANRKLVLEDGEVEDVLTYQLYSNSDFTGEWGHTIGEDTIGDDDATGLDTDYEIYARVPAHQNAPAGNYSDTVTATIWYHGSGLAP